MAHKSLEECVKSNEANILADWIARQLKSVGSRRDLINEGELKRQSSEFLSNVVQGLRSGGDDIEAAPWAPAREQLARISQSRALQGFTPTETAMFVFSLKPVLFDSVRKSSPSAEDLATNTWSISVLLDALGLFTTESFLKRREDVIVRQQQEMMELSTPVVTLWAGVLALPLIGTLDSARTQVVMESLLQRIVDTGSTIAILDITGVPTVDTLVAQHLLKTVAAARLMGADCIISGIRPQIAQTIVHLGVDLNTVTTKATLADAFAIALKRTGLGIVKTAPAAPTAAGA
jgi:rsbT co-antagonist protein RsbR